MNCCEPFNSIESCEECMNEAFPKPGKNPKKKLSTKRTLQHNIERPEDPFCRRCDDEIGNEKHRHLETFRKYEIGKGLSTKSHDRFTAWLCDECDDIMSNQRPNKNHTMAVLRHAEEWNWLIMKTWLL